MNQNQMGDIESDPVVPGEYASSAVCRARQTASAMPLGEYAKTTTDRSSPAVREEHADCPDGTGRTP